MTVRRRPSKQRYHIKKESSCCYTHLPAAKLLSCCWKVAVFVEDAFRLAKSIEDDEGGEEEQCSRK
jgi:hypothetical protein